MNYLRKLFRPIPVLLLAFMLLTHAAAAEEELYKLSDIKAGMKGKVHTTFKGYKPVVYDAEILGVSKNGIAIGADMILVTLRGDEIEKKGVFHGMSGSPLYIDGKFAGTVSFMIGNFPKQIIAGVTPAEYVIGTGRVIPEMKGRQGVDVISTLTGEYFKGFKLNDPTLNSLLPKPVPLATNYFLNDAKSGNLNLALQFRGFNRSIISKLNPLASGLGFTPIDSGGFQAPGAGGGAIPSAQSLADEIKKKRAKEPELVPGCAVSIPLVRGDFSISASGTLSHIDGKNLYAFGHEFLNAGEVDFPLHMAKVIEVFGSDLSGFHIVEQEAEAGRIVSDRVVGIYGRKGEKAYMIPVEIQLRNNGVLLNKYEMEMAQNRLTPILFLIANQNAILRTFNLSNLATVGVKFYIELKDSKYKSIIADDIYTGETAAADASLLPAVAAYMLLNNEFEKIKFGRLKVTFNYSIEPKRAEIIKVRFNKDEISPGEKLNLKIYLRTWRGSTVVKEAAFRIPETFGEGYINIVVGNAGYITSIENRSIGETPKLIDVDHLIRLINSLRSGNNIYIQFRSPSSGIYTRGRFLSDLPPTAMEVMTARDNDGDIIPLRTALMSEDRLRTDYLIDGHQVLKIKIKKKLNIEKKEKK